MAKITIVEAVSNLRKKYNKAVKFELSVWDFNIRNKPQVSYGLYIEDTTGGTGTFLSMEELQKYYNELMKVDING